MVSFEGLGAAQRGPHFLEDLGSLQQLSRPHRGLFTWELELLPRGEASSPTHTTAEASCDISSLRISHSPAGLGDREGKEAPPTHGNSRQASCLGWPGTSLWGSGMSKAPVRTSTTTLGAHASHFRAPSLCFLIQNYGQ